MPLTAILSLHKYELLALKMLEVLRLLFQTTFSQLIDHFSRDRNTHVKKGCISDAHTEI